MVYANEYLNIAPRRRRPSVRPLTRRREDCCAPSRNALAVRCFFPDGCAYGLLKACLRRIINIYIYVYR